MKYRKKPVVIEAMQVPMALKTGEQIEQWGRIGVWLGAGGKWTLATGKIEINTLEGTMTAEPGDWIIKGVKGEFYPCKPDIFEATYEKAEEA